MSAAETTSGIFQHLSIARITLECQSPLSIGTGEQDTLYDVLPMRDADGLPTIPGTSLAGILRAKYQSKFGLDESNSLFGIGRPDGDDTDKSPYHASRLFLSWARVHKSDNVPAPLAISPSDIQQDPILHWLSQDQPIYRDHVKINDKGTSLDGGKFSRGAIPTGSRFTFEIIIERFTQDTTEFDNLISCLTSPDLYLGGATYRGYGNITTIHITHKHLDLKQGEDRDWLRGYSRDLSTPLQDPSKPACDVADKSSIGDAIHYKLTLRPEGFYRFGGGDTALRETKLGMDGNYDKDADDFVKTERIILWEKNTDNQLQAKISQPRLLIPAASVKGAIRHRTAFHAQRLSTVENIGDAVTHSLFGHQTQNNEGFAGRVHIPDQYLEFDEIKHIGRMSHNAIDRFTQGTIDGALYEEELVFGLGFEVSISIAEKRNIDKSTFDPPDLDIQALKLALEDITQARLPLGAGASSGHGFFTGDIVAEEDNLS